MKRSCLCVVVAAAVLLGVVPSAAPQTGREVSRPGQEGAPPGPVDSVAVVAFANITGLPDDAWLGRGIVETVGVDLAGNGRLRVVVGDAVMAAFEALGADPTTAVDQHDTVVGVGRRLGVRWVVSGGYQRVGNQLRLTARIVDVATATVRHALTVDGEMPELFGLQDRLASNLRRFLAAPDEDAPRIVNTGPPSADPVEDVGLGVTPAPPVVRSTGSAGFAAVPTLRIDGPPPPMAPETLARDAGGRTTVRAVAIDVPLRIDGTLDEAAYDVVPALGGFIQQRPDEGEPITERTDAWVFYDNQNVYVTARLWDSAPESQWVANEMQRDSRQLISNDSFSVALDTFYDRRNGFAFMINPIGGFLDMQVTDEGNPNFDWNPIWNVRTGRFDGGWTVEMAIPFKSLRFQPGESQVWGLQLGRRIYWKNESAYLTAVPISAGGAMFRLSAAATLTGVRAPQGSRIFEIKPFAIGSVGSDMTAVPAVINDGDGDFGVDVKYGVTQGLTADFTYNTDFAQVEVDEQQVNLTRFSLFFPEKREFFLEGRGIFDFGRGVSFGGVGTPGGGGRTGGGRTGGFSGGGSAPTIFFSRRIGLESGQAVPILGGGRLTGKVGAFTVGALNIQTDDAVTADAVSTNFTAIRVKRDLFRRSSLGALFTGRSVAVDGNGSNEAFGVDGLFSFYDNLNFSGYYARTRTPGLEGEDDSYQTAFTYNGDLYAVGVDHLMVGDNFNPEVGFLQRDDFRRTFAQAQFSPRPASIAAVRQFTWGGSLDYIENGAGQVETRIAKVSFETEFENSDRFSADSQRSYEFLVDPFPIATGVTIPVGRYDFQDYYVSYAMGAQRRVAGTFSLQRGEFFGGHITAVGYSRGRIEVTPQLSIEPSVSINRIELPEGDFTAKLGTARVTYTLTPRMFFSGLLQYNSTRDSLSTNLRLRWEYQPGSELFVVYNDQRDTELGRSFPLLENRAFVVKLTRLFRF